MRRFSRESRLSAFFTTISWKKATAKITLWERDVTRLAKDFLASVRGGSFHGTKNYNIPQKLDRQIR